VFGAGTKVKLLGYCLPHQLQKEYQQTCEFSLWSGMVLSVIYARVQRKTLKRKTMPNSLGIIRLRHEKRPPHSITSSWLTGLLCPIIPQPTARLVYSPLLLRNLRFALSLAISTTRRNVLHFHVAVFILHPLRVCRAGAIHHSQPTGSQLVDSPYGVDRFVQSSSGVEVLLHRGQEVLVAAVGLGAGYPGV
jgi:hypothetical protein